MAIAFNIFCYFYLSFTVSNNYSNYLKIDFNNIYVKTNKTYL